MKSKIEILHENACNKQEYYYIDPATGHRVLTAFFLTKRKYCCNSGCRHCPYGFDKISGKHIIFGKVIAKSGSVVLVTNSEQLVLVPLNRSACTEEIIKTFIDHDVKITGIREISKFHVEEWEFIK